MKKSKKSERSHPHIDDYIDQVKAEGLLNVNPSDYKLDIDDWVMPSYLEVGNKVEVKTSLYAVIGNMIPLLIGYLLLSIGFLYVDMKGMTGTVTLAVIIIFIKHLNHNTVALKFDNPLHKPGHEIRYNLDNTNGGRGREAFILDKEDVRTIILKYDKSGLIGINFGSSDLDVDVSDFKKKELLEQFMIFYASKYDKELIVQGC
ncbi:hypothetical protein EZV73_10090 [Acidaminobacter sp. JC074]|uniref:hypothetical protein n=1 Tax=Acidaminobacter sp. JC074 TaxID=2530199 RepID=UPI001F0E5142|nr:hypothetical protein [Acidaminobacter sp. JC074]MCH4887925.1 hypothetical protein [Acidaminobacter sp. JC074]